MSDLASIEGGQGSRRELTKNVSLILEEMDLKLCEAKENYLESTADMNNKIDDLKARLVEKDLKIEQLEEELAVVKRRYKTDYQLLWGKYEDCKLEIELLKENQMKVEQKYVNLEKDVERQRNNSLKNNKELTVIKDNRCPRAQQTNIRSGECTSYANAGKSTDNAHEQLNSVCDSNSDFEADNQHVRSQTTKQSRRRAPKDMVTDKPQAPSKVSAENSLFHNDTSEFPQWLGRLPLIESPKRTNSKKLLLNPTPTQNFRRRLRHFPCHPRSKPSKRWLSLLEKDRFSDWQSYLKIVHQMTTN